MKDFFTPGFYKFLLGFSVIILVSFGVLLFLGVQSEPAVSEPAAVPGERG